MAFYSGDERQETVMDRLRTTGGLPFQELSDSLSSEMAYKTVWKACQCLIVAGIVRREEEVGLSGHKRFRLVLEEWYALDDTQRERMVAAMERMADAMERIVPGTVYNIGSATIDNRVMPMPVETPSVILPMETKEVQ